MGAWVDAFQLRELTRQFRYPRSRTRPWPATPPKPLSKNRRFCARERECETPRFPYSTSCSENKILQLASITIHFHCNEWSQDRLDIWRFRENKVNSHRVCRLFFLGSFPVRFFGRTRNIQKSCRVYKIYKANVMAQFFFVFSRANANILISVRMSISAGVENKRKVHACI